MNCAFDEKLHEKLQNDYILGLKRCVYIRDTKTATFYFAVSVVPDEAEKERILAAVRALTPADIQHVEAAYKRIYFDREILEKFLKNYLARHAASVLCGVDFQGFTLNDHTLTIPLDENLGEYADERLQIALQNALSEEYYAIFRVNFVHAQVFTAAEPEEVLVAPPANRVIRVANAAKFVGDLVEEEAGYIEDAKTPADDVVLCGRINRYAEYKKTDDKGRERIRFAFDLEDFTGKMRCVFFAAESNAEKLRGLGDGDEIICKGSLDDKFGRGLSYRVRAISHCELPKEFAYRPPTSKPASARYRVVFPTPYVRGSQVDLFGEMDDFVAPVLKEKDFVAYDFETTGLDPENDKIIEIGAVRIVAGKVTEAFSTFVDPGKALPEKIVELTGITDDMVRGAPSIEDVMPDFYKFTRDAVLFGHNSDGFDIKFLQKNAIACGYYFDNETEDTLLLARKYLKDLPNYRLETVSEYLHVALESHHRATDDAIACGDILVEIMNRNARAALAEQKMGAAAAEN